MHCRSKLIWDAKDGSACSGSDRAGGGLLSRCQAILDVFFAYLASMRSRGVDMELYKSLQVEIVGAVPEDMMQRMSDHYSNSLFAQLRGT